MPSSASHAYQRNSSPKAEALPRILNNSVTETGSGKIGRKKTKHAVQKTTNKQETEASPAAPGELRARTARVTIEDNTTETTSKPRTLKGDFPSAVILEAPGSAEHMLDPYMSISADAWERSIPATESTAMNLLEDMSDEIPAPAGNAPTQRGGFSSKTPPASPLPRMVQPASSSPGMSPPSASRPTHDIPLRIPSQSLDASSPPPPHLPQAHFYGAPDVDFGVGYRARHTNFEQEVRFLRFTELPSPVDRRQKGNSQVVLLNTDDRLNVAAVAKDKLNIIGAIEKVGGTIFEAEILTWDFGVDPFAHLRPLIALVVHGPRRRERPGQMVSGGASDPGPQPFGLNEILEYQTRVEIYSLGNHEHIVTLLSSQPTSGLPSFRGMAPSAPPPVGGFKLDARGNFLTISSGTSGEIFVFGIETDVPYNFRCLGKFWTSVQTTNDRRYSNSSNSTDPDTSPADLNRRVGPSPLPIMSLSDRWLAIVPPGPASDQPLPVNVTKDLILDGTQGMGSRNAPPRPPVSCVVDSPDVEGFINRVARGVAQEVVRGARWLGGQSLQTWNSYWSKDHQNQPPNHTLKRNSGSNDANFLAGAFPPTHAPESRASSTESQVVSVIDLQVLATESLGSRSDASAHFATFEPPHGVSFLSFSPDGLFIVSATRKGDVQYVWDLKQMRHLRASMLLAAADSEVPARSAQVTQVARFARLTPTNIIDIEWNRPNGDRFAVVTKNGTIHVFDLSPSAFQWPPVRRSPREVPSSAPTSPTVIAQADESTAVGGVFSSAMKLAGKTQPMLATLRGRAPSTGGSSTVGSGTNSIAFASATGIRGSRAVAAGLSKSVGAATGTMNSLRHAGDNRLHLSGLASNPARSHVYWARSRKKPSLLVIDDGSIKSFRISRRRSSSKPKRQPVSTIDTKPSFSVLLPTSAQLPSPRTTAKHHAQRPSSDEDRQVSGYWTHPLVGDTQPPRITHPLSYAEIDTNAPYQPFHSDRRVSLSVYNDRSVGAGIATDHEPWVFGDQVATTRLNIRPPSLSDEEDQDAGGSVLYRHTSLTNREGAGDHDESTADRIVVTTRRRKNRSQLLLPQQQQQHQGDPTSTTTGDSKILENDDGFFEDDCDVLDFAEDRV